MRHTEWCIYVCCKISQLRYEDENILIMMAHEFEWLLILPGVLSVIMHHRQKGIGLCTYVGETRCKMNTAAHSYH